VDHYGEIVLETRGVVMKFDVNYAQCTLLGNGPVSFGIDLDTVKKPVTIEEGFVRTAKVALYIDKRYEAASDLHECIEEFNSSDGECVFSFLDHEELYDITFGRVEVSGDSVYIELTGETIDVISTDPAEFTNVTVKSWADLKIDLSRKLP
jgi:hypothetical protein